MIAVRRDRPNCIICSPLQRGAFWSNIFSYWGAETKLKEEKGSKGYSSLDNYDFFNTPNSGWFMWNKFYAWENNGIMVMELMSIRY